MTDEFEPIDPHEAAERHREDKRDKYSPSTDEAHRSRLNIFADWLLDERNIGNRNEISGRDHMRCKACWLPMCKRDSAGVESEESGITDTAV